MAESSCPVPDSIEVAAEAAPAPLCERVTRHHALHRHISPPVTHRGDTAAMQKGTSVSLRVELQKLCLNHGHHHLNVICTKISSCYLLDFSNFDQFLLSGVLRVSLSPTRGSV